MNNLDAASAFFLMCDQVSGGSNVEPAGGATG
jgi:hypothetical protein